MYIPKHFAQHDREQMLQFMQRYLFATLVTVKDGQPLATHLPFIIEEHGEEIILLTHMAKANPQWQNILDQDVLVIFQEPHAYISPSLYENIQSVPTWNYVAVHAYGKVEYIDDEDEQLQLLEKMMTTYDPAYLEQWKILPEEYIKGLLKGIKALQVRVRDIQGKEKLSQNRPEKDRQNVIESLEAEKDTSAKAIAEYMRKRQQ